MENTFSMSKADRHTLDVNLPLLTKDLMIDKMFLATLKQRGTLNDERIEDIEYYSKRQDMNAAFLKIIRSRGPKAFESFIFALRETNQDDLAQALTGSVQATVPNKQATGVEGGGAEGGPGFPMHEKFSQMKLETKTPGEAPTVDERDASERLSSIPDIPEEPDIPIDLKPINPELLKNPKKYYQMSRCRAIIMINEKFEGGKNREGSAVDKRNLMRLFDALGYDCEDWDDCESRDIERKISEERKRLESCETDGLIFVACSHGKQDFITGTDGKRVHIQQQIIDQFDGKNCSSLISKPKIFIFQCCRGGGITEGVEFVPGNEADSFEDDDFSVTVHEKSDIFEIHSTYDGSKSYRKSDSGSHFIRCLVKNIVKYAHEEDLASIIPWITQDLEAIDIRAPITDESGIGRFKNVKQIPVYKSVPKKKFYFLQLKHEKNS